MNIRKDISFRVYITFFAVLGLALMVVGRVAYMQTAKGDYWKAKGDSLHCITFEIKAERGTIFSEDGYILSTSIPVFDLYMDLAVENLTEKNGMVFYKYIDSISYGMSKIFGDRTFDEYKEQITNAFLKQNRYYLLKRKVSFEQYKVFMQLPLVNQGRNKSGIIVEVKDKRINPYRLLANRTIGLSREDASKNVGLEKTYDSILKGSTGSIVMQKHSGTYIPVDGSDYEPQKGKNIVTTLDTYIQDVTEGALLQMMTNNNSLHGTAMVMETQTGKIKAIANLGRQADGTYIEDMNYGIGKRTEPGSVFKLATLVALMEDKKINENTIVNVEGGAKSFNGLVIRDVHYGRTDMDIKEAFARSSNVAFAKLANEQYKNNPKRFLNYLHKFRLDVPTGIDILASSGNPIVKKPGDKTWSASTIPFMAHGYEQLLSPLHMLVFYNAIANNGKLMKPYLVNSIQEYGKDIIKFEPKVLVENICSPSTLKSVKACLVDVVDKKYGTAFSIKSDYYKIAGKTGTAVTALDNRGYNKNNKIYQSSFIGFFPADKPKYTIAVVIQNGYNSKESYGSTVAAPVFKMISDKIYNRFISGQNFNLKGQDSGSLVYVNKIEDAKYFFNYLKRPYIEKINPNHYVTIVNFNKSQSSLISTESNITGKKNTMPDVRGMVLKDALYFLEKNKLKVKIKGQGRVVTQSKFQGVETFEGEEVEIVLE